MKLMNKCKKVVRFVFQTIILNKYTFAYLSYLKYYTVCNQLNRNTSNYLNVYKLLLYGFYNCILEGLINYIILNPKGGHTLIKNSLLAFRKGK